MKAINLKTNYLINPIGVSFKNPVFTWNIIDCKKQTAYQVICYSNNSLLLDTGKVKSSSMRYECSLNLHSKEVIKWNVIIWDENDNKGDISDDATFEMGLLHKDDWLSCWIKGNYIVNKKNRYPVDYFKKEFELKDVSKARLYITSLGLYEAHINGVKVGNFSLTPGSTDPRVRVNHDTYDVTKLLKNGKNDIVIMLSDGWYRGSIGAKGFTYVFGKHTSVIAMLDIFNTNNVLTTIKTDETWSWSNDGPIRFADLKDGEIIDNRLKPSFSSFAVLSKYDGIISSSNAPHIEEVEFNTPINVIKTNTNKTTLEYKNNCAGYVSFKVYAKEGDKIDITLGELIDDNNDVTLNNVQCIRKGKKTPLQEIHFTCGEGLNEYNTKFFYGGFKYATIDSTCEINYNDVKQVVIFSKMDEISSFCCSNELINIFHDNTIRSLKSNSVDIPTDCPTRERMGWTGDSQIIFNTASYLFDYAAFISKHINDVYDRQDKNGRLPQIAPYSAEDWFMDVMNGSVGWADVGILVPYRMYLKYGDTNILKEYYDRMVSYALFMIKRCGRAKGLYAIYAKPLHLSKENRKYGVNTGQSYGEWAEPNDVKAFEWTDFAMPHPEESMAYTSYILSLMVKISNILGKTDYVELFKEYSEGVKRAYQELVTKPEFTLDTDRQAKLVRPLYMKLLDEETETYAKDRLIKALDNYSWRLGTGFLSTPFILKVLEEINPIYAYKLLENEEMPGWLYMAKNNTGTIWEGWEGPNAQLGISSLNHYSKGAMVEWLYSSMLGIIVDGENHFILKPIVGGSLTYARGSYKSIYGLVESSWEIKHNVITYRFTLPTNTTADVYLNGKHYTIESGYSEFKV